MATVHWKFIIFFSLSSTFWITSSSPISLASSVVPFSKSLSKKTSSSSSSSSERTKPRLPQVIINRLIDHSEENEYQLDSPNTNMARYVNDYFSSYSNKLYDYEYPSLPRGSVEDSEARRRHGRYDYEYTFSAPRTTTVSPWPMLLTLLPSIKLRIRPGGGDPFTLEVTTRSTTTRSTTTRSTTPRPTTPRPTTPRSSTYFRMQAPSYIGSECYLTEQCQRIDPASTCDLTHESIRTCVCPSDMFVTANRSACAPMPKAIGDSCSVTHQCTRQITHTYCNDVTKRCQCLDGFFDDDKTACHSDPMHLGDYCRDDKHCAKMISQSMCETENSTCVCEYGYQQETVSSCAERQVISPYVTFAPPTAIVCQKQCKNWTNSLCIKQSGHAYAHCRCDYRHARRYNDTKCVPIQTYELKLDIVKEADKYDYVPLQFKPQYKSSKLPAFQRFAERITLNGLMKLFETSSMKDRYVASDVTVIQNLDETRKSNDKGVKATILVHLTADYLNATPLKEIQKVLEEQVNSSDGELGQSRLKLAMPFSSAITFEDYDECEMIERNDCDEQAVCLNTLGSFMCVCRSRYEDVSKDHGLRPGRKCAVPSTTNENSDLCSSDDCETRWEFVALVFTLFLLLLMSFIAYEIIQRKQTFSARKLYKKFGTTKIKKLRQASMRRIQEAKKRKKEESKKKKEESKQKKEDLKREKSEKRKRKSEEKKRKQEEKKGGKRWGKSEGDDEMFEEIPDIKERSPTPPIEIMHPPSLPFSVTSSDSASFDASSLPGSVNTPQMERTPRRIVSSIEESPV